MRFHVGSISQDGLVLGRNSQSDIPVGSLFTSVKKAVLAQGSTTEYLVSDGISLELLSVHWYGRSIDYVPGGHSAGLKLIGQGMDVLGQALESLNEGEYLSLEV